MKIKRKIVTAFPLIVGLGKHQSSLTRAAITPAWANIIPAIHFTRSYLIPPISARRIKASSFKSRLVATSSSSYSTLACSSVDAAADFCNRVITSACWSLKPAFLSSLKNSCVSKVMVVMGLLPVFDLANSLPRLTAAANQDYAFRTAPHWADGFSRPNNSGTEALCRLVHGFFYALTLYGGWCIGEPKGSAAPESALLTRHIIRRHLFSSSCRWFKTITQESVMTNQSQVTPEFRPELAIIDGQITTTSVAIAKHFNKRHDNVIQAITKLECSPEFRLLNFKESFYEQQIPNGAAKNVICYEITRDGFMFLAMGFTGAKAAQWKEAYILAFNRMESQLLENPKPLPTPVLRTKLLVVIDNGEISQSVVPFGCCIVDPDDPVSVSTFVNEYVPSTPDMLLALSLAYISKLKNCQDAAFNRMKTK